MQAFLKAQKPLIPAQTKFDYLQERLFATEDKVCGCARAG